MAEGIIEVFVNYIYYGCWWCGNFILRVFNTVGKIKFYISR